MILAGYCRKCPSFFWLCILRTTIATGNNGCFCPPTRSKGRSISESTIRSRSSTPDAAKLSPRARAASGRPARRRSRFTTRSTRSDGATPGGNSRSRSSTGRTSQLANTSMRSALGPPSGRRPWRSMRGNFGRSSETSRTSSCPTNGARFDFGFLHQKDYYLEHYLDPAINHCTEQEISGGFWMVLYGRSGIIQLESRHE